MRARDISTHNGRLLVCGRHDDSRAAGLLFLVARYADVATMGTITDAVARVHTASRGWTLDWVDVTDDGELSTFHPGLHSSTVLRVEAAEFADLAPGDLDALLIAALARADRCEAVLFPEIGAALGASAEGVQFVGREAEIATLAATIRPGVMTLLEAPRRTGKTSLLREFMRRGPDGIHAAYVDVESAFDWDEAVAAIVASVGQPDRPAVRLAIAREGADAVLLQALQRFHSAEHRSALCIDELVYFLRTMTSEMAVDVRPSAIRAVLGTLAGACSDAGICLVFAGSLDLVEYLTDEVGIDAADLPASIRDAVRYPLPALEATPQHLRAFLIGTGIVPEGGDAAWLRENIDLGMPLATLQFLEQLAARVRATGAVATAALGPALDEFLRTTTVFRDVMDRFQQRGQSVPEFRRAVAAFMTRLLAPDPMTTERALEVLESHAQQSEPAARETLRWVLENLPVRVVGVHVVLASKVFGRWWLTVHG